MAPHNVNPFYIEPNQQSDEVDEWAWEDDTDDLEELLGDGDDGQYPLQPHSRSGGIPVQNLLQRRGSRFRYMAVALVVLVILVAVLTSSSRGSTIPTDGSLASRDSVPDDRPRIVVLGERHSGLQWLEHSLSLCFPNASVSSTLTRAGMFFQDEPKDRNVHVVAVAVNAYDWVELMRKNPLYMPNHAEISGWSDFLAKEWTMTRPERDDEMEGKEGNVCQLGFSFVEVVSCLPSLVEDPAANPIYEMKRDGSGKAFESVLGLRAAKFRNHVEEMGALVQSVHPVQYESLVATTNLKGEVVPGIFDLLEKLASKINLEWSCTPAQADSLLSPSPLSTDFIKYMNDHVDWTAEKLFGYTPKDENSTSDGATDDDTKPSNVDDDQPDSVSEQKTATPNESDYETGTTNDGLGDDALPETSAQKPSKETSVPSSPAEEHTPPPPSVAPVLAEDTDKTSNTLPQSPHPSSSDKSAKELSETPSSLESATSKPTPPDGKVTPSTPSLPPKIDGSGESSLGDDYDASQNYDDEVPSGDKTAGDKSESVGDEGDDDDDEEGGGDSDGDGDDDDDGDDGEGDDGEGDDGEGDDGKGDDGEGDNDEGDNGEGDNGEGDRGGDDETLDDTNDAGNGNDEKVERAPTTLTPVRKSSHQPSSYPTLRVSDTPSAYPTFLVTPEPSVSETPEPTAAPSPATTASQSSVPQKGEHVHGGHDDSAKTGKTSSDTAGNETADTTAEAKDKKKKTKHKEHSHNAEDGSADKHDSDSTGNEKKKGKHKSHPHSDPGENESNRKHERRLVKITPTTTKTSPAVLNHDS